MRLIGKCLPALLLAVPYGALADRVGRKKVLGLSMGGIVAAFGWQLMIGEEVQDV